MSVSSKKGQRFSIEVPADSRYLKAIRAFFQSLLRDVFGDEAEMLVLALDESCANVVKHRPKDGALEDLKVSAECRPGFVRFKVWDFCCTADIPNIKPRNLKDVRPGGLGTHFVGEIMDKVEFQPDEKKPGRMVLILEKSLPAVEAKNG